MEFKSYQMPEKMIVYHVFDTKKRDNLGEAIEKIEDEAVPYSVIFNSDGSVPVEVWRQLVDALKVQARLVDVRKWVGVRNPKTKRVLVLWSNVAGRSTGQLMRSLMFATEDLEAELEKRILELEKEKCRENWIAKLTGAGYTYNEVYVTIKLLHAEGKLIHINQVQKQAIARVLDNWAKTGCVIEKAIEKGDNIFLVLENGTAFKVDITGFGEWVVEGWLGGHEISDIWQAIK